MRFFSSNTRRTLAPGLLLAAFVLHSMVWTVAPGLHLLTSGHLVHPLFGAPGCHPHDPRPTTLSVPSLFTAEGDCELCKAALKSSLLDRPARDLVQFFQPTDVLSPLVQATRPALASPLGVPSPRAPPILPA